MKISAATVAVWLAFSPAASGPPSPPQPAKCCSKCEGTGMVWSGDGLKRLQCPCPDTCPCAKNRPRMTLSGTTCEGSKCHVR